MTWSGAIRTVLLVDMRDIQKYITRVVHIRFIHSIALYAPKIFI